MSGRPKLSTSVVPPPDHKRGKRRYTRSSDRRGQSTASDSGSDLRRRRKTEGSTIRKRSERESSHSSRYRRVERDLGRPGQSGPYLATVKERSSPSSSAPSSPRRSPLMHAESAGELATLDMAAAVVVSRAKSSAHRRSPTVDTVVGPDSTAVVNQGMHAPLGSIRGRRTRSNSTQAHSPRMDGDEDTVDPTIYVSPKVAAASGLKSHDSTSSASGILSKLGTEHLTRGSRRSSAVETRVSPRMLSRSKSPRPHSRQQSTSMRLLLTHDSSNPRDDSLIDERADLVMALTKPTEFSVKRSSGSSKPSRFTFRRGRRGHESAQDGSQSTRRVSTGSGTRSAVTSGTTARLTSTLSSEASSGLRTPKLGARVASDGVTKRGNLLAPTTPDTQQSSRRPSLFDKFVDLISKKSSLSSTGTTTASPALSGSSLASGGTGFGSAHPSSSLVPLKLSPPESSLSFIDRSQIPQPGTPTDDERSMTEQSMTISDTPQKTPALDHTKGTVGGASGSSATGSSTGIRSKLDLSDEKVDLMDFLSGLGEAEMEAMMDEPIPEALPSSRRHAMSSSAGSTTGPATKMAALSPIGYTPGPTSTGIRLDDVLESDVLSAGPSTSPLTGPSLLSVMSESTLHSTPKLDSMSLTGVSTLMSSEEDCIVETRIHVVGCHESCVTSLGTPHFEIRVIGRWMKRRPLKKVAWVVYRKIRDFIEFDKHLKSAVRDRPALKKRIPVLASLMSEAADRMEDMKNSLEKDTDPTVKGASMPAYESSLLSSKFSSLIGGQTHSMSSLSNATISNWYDIWEKSYALNKYLQMLSFDEYFGQHEYFKLFLGIIDFDDYRHSHWHMFNTYRHGGAGNDPYSVASKNRDSKNVCDYLPQTSLQLWMRGGSKMVVFDESFKLQLRFSVRNLAQIFALDRSFHPYRSCFLRIYRMSASGTRRYLIMTTEKVMLTINAAKIAAMIAKITAENAMGEGDSAAGSAGSSHHHSAGSSSSSYSSSKRKSKRSGRRSHHSSKIDTIEEDPELMGDEQEDDTDDEEVGEGDGGISTPVPSPIESTTVIDVSDKRESAVESLLREKPPSRPHVTFADPLPTSKKSVSPKKKSTSRRPTRQGRSSRRTGVKSKGGDAYARPMRKSKHEPKRPRESAIDIYDDFWQDSFQTLFYKVLLFDFVPDRRCQIEVELCLTDSLVKPSKSSGSKESVLVVGSTWFHLMHVLCHKTTAFEAKRIIRTKPVLEPTTAAGSMKEESRLLAQICLSVRRFENMDDYAPNIHHITPSTFPLPHLHRRVWSTAVKSGVDKSHGSMSLHYSLTELSTTLSGGSSSPPEGVSGVMIPSSRGSDRHLDEEDNQEKKVRSLINDLDRATTKTVRSTLSKLSHWFHVNRKPIQFVEYNEKSERDVIGQLLLDICKRLLTWLANSLGSGSSSSEWTSSLGSSDVRITQGSRDDICKLLALIFGLYQWDLRHADLWEYDEHSGLPMSAMCTTSWNKCMQRYVEYLCLAMTLTCRIIVSKCFRICKDTRDSTGELEYTLDSSKLTEEESMFALKVIGLSSMRVSEVHKRVLIKLLHFKSKLLRMCKNERYEEVFERENAYLKDGDESEVVDMSMMFRKRSASKPEPSSAMRNVFQSRSGAMTGTAAHDYTSWQEWYEEQVLSRVLNAEMSASEMHSLEFYFGKNNTSSYLSGWDYFMQERSLSRLRQLFAFDLRGGDDEKRGPSVISGGTHSGSISGSSGSSSIAGSSKNYRGLAHDRVFVQWMEQNSDNIIIEMLDSVGKYSHGIVVCWPLVPGYARLSKAIVQQLIWSKLGDFEPTIVEYPDAPKKERKGSLLSEDDIDMDAQRDRNRAILNEAKPSQRAIGLVSRLMNIRGMKSQLGTYCDALLCNTDVMYAKKVYFCFKYITEWINNTGINAENEEGTGDALTNYYVNARRGSSFYSMGGLTAWLMNVVVSPEVTIGGGASNRSLPVISSKVEIPASPPSGGMISSSASSTTDLLYTMESESCELFPSMWCFDRFVQACEIILLKQYDYQNICILLSFILRFSHLFPDALRLHVIRDLLISNQTVFDCLFGHWNELLRKFYHRTLLFCTNRVGYFNDDRRQRANEALDEMAHVLHRPKSMEKAGVSSSSSTTTTTTVGSGIGSDGVTSASSSSSKKPPPMAPSRALSMNSVFGAVATQVSATNNEVMRAALAKGHKMSKVFEHIIRLSQPSEEESRSTLLFERAKPASDVKIAGLKPKRDELDPKILRCVFVDMTVPQRLDTDSEILDELAVKINHAKAHSRKNHYLNRSLREFHEMCKYYQSCQLLKKDWIFGEVVLPAVVFSLEKPSKHSSSGPSAFFQ